MTGTSGYVVVTAVILAGILLVTAGMTARRLIAPRAATPAKLTTYESGVDPVGVGGQVGRGLVELDLGTFDEAHAVGQPLVHVRQRTQALEQYRRFRELELPRPYGEPQLSDPQVSFQLAHGLPDLDFLHMLLRDRSEDSRLKQVTQFLSSFIPKVRESGRMQKLAPLNGHGRSVPNL